MKIADASVIYKWYISEQETPEALALLEDFRSGVEQLAVPDLILYELANALRYNRKLKPEDVESALENFISLGIIIITPNLTIIKKTAHFAMRHDITIYDAAYAVLAESLGCDFITADKKLHRKLSSLPFVKSL